MLFVVPTSFYHAVLSAVNELVGNFLGFIPDDPCVPCFVVSFISFSSVLGRSNSPPYFSIILAKKSVHLSKSAFTIGAPPVCPDDDPNAAVLVHAALVCATLHLPGPAIPVVSCSLSKAGWPVLIAGGIPVPIDSFHSSKHLLVVRRQAQLL